MNWQLPTGIVVSLVALGVLVIALYPAGASSRDARSDDAAAIPIAVLGDSSSHSYQDQISFPAASSERGGKLRSKTLQWTEVLARLRGDQLDLGPWVSWGRPGPVAWSRELIGLEGGRAPKKEDYLYNFANSGAPCADLMGAGTRQRVRQAPRLVELMDRAPAFWKRGVVVIRIGTNDWYGGRIDWIDLHARNPDAPELKAATDACVSQIRQAIDLIHASHPQTKIMLVGLLNDSDDPAYVDRWLSQKETRNIQIALDRFNAELKKLIATVPGGAFFDDDAWFKQRWGAHSSPEKPYRNTVTIANVLKVTNTAGDEPTNSVLADHHAGLAFNALWAQSMVARLREAYGLPLRPITDDEVAKLVLPLAGLKVPGS